MDSKDPSCRDWGVYRHDSGTSGLSLVPRNVTSCKHACNDLDSPFASNQKINLDFSSFFSLILTFDVIQ